MTVLIERQARVDGIYIQSDGRSMTRRLVVSMVIPGTDDEGKGEQGMCLRFLVPATEAAAWGKRLGRSVTVLIVDPKERP